MGAVERQAIWLLKLSGKTDNPIKDTLLKWICGQSELWLLFFCSVLIHSFLQRQRYAIIKEINIIKECSKKKLIKTLKMFAIPFL
jgi:hypothetical protein